MLQLLLALQVLPDASADAGPQPWIDKTAVVLLAIDLPDIPSRVVAQSIRIQSREDGPLEPPVLGCRGWATSRITLEPLFTGGSAPSEAFDTAEAFAKGSLEYVQEYRNRREAREIVTQFKARHGDFIRAMADIRNQLDTFARARPKALR